MTTYNLLFSLFALVTLAMAEEFDYCKITCNGVQHTSCTYKTDTPGPKCKGFDAMRLFTVIEKEEILALHNRLREQVAKGEAGNQPPAKEMPALVWSLELEQIARRWALQCDYRHDECRNLKDNTYAGQNIAWYHHPDKREFTEQLVQEWFDEYKLYTPTGDGPFTMDSKTDHYTQIAWAKTLYLGCERTVYTLPSNGKEYPNAEYLVCVYAPGGNMQGEPVYLTLPPGEKGRLLPGASPREGETGKPEDTGALGGAPKMVGTLQCLAMLTSCLVISLKSAILLLEA